MGASRDLEADRVLALRISHLRKAYSSNGVTMTVLSQVSFEVEEGAFVTLLGPSGCGKTTLLKICASLVRASDGIVDWMGTGRPAPPGSYGMVFQTPALLPWRTVLANVLLPAQVLHMDLRDARARAQSFLRLVGLEGTERMHPGQLSGGMQQRAGIARALIHDPKILFMDEPFGALDAITRDNLNLELQRLTSHQAMTVLFVTHSIQEAVFLSDKVIVLSGRPGPIVGEVRIAAPRPRTLEGLAGPDSQAIQGELRRMLEAVGPQPP